MSTFRGFSRGTRRFHLSVQNTTLVSALKFSILFQLQHSGSKSKRAFPGKFYRRSSHASGRLKVGCG
jgi:hypothetical protein